MREAVPQAVLERPKTALGNLLTSLLQRPETEWVDHWQPVPELAQFVTLDAIRR